MVAAASNRHETVLLRAPSAPKTTDDSEYWGPIETPESLKTFTRQFFDEVARLRAESQLYARPMKPAQQRELLESYGACGPTTDLAGETSDPNWHTIYSGPYADRSTVDSLDWFRREARFYYRWNDHYSGILRAIVDHTVGVELSVKINVLRNADDPELGNDEPAQKELRGAWKRWKNHKATKWRKRVREHALRKLRDGESFWRKFTPATNTETGAVGPEWRFVEPDRVASDKSDDEKIRYGVEFADGDAETPVAYHIQKSDGSEPYPITADQIEHFRLNSDLNAVRGLPFLLTATRRIRDYADWLTARLLLNKFRSYIVMVWKHTAAVGGAVAGGNAATRTGSRTVSTSSGGSINQDTRKISPGTEVRLPPGMELEFTSPNIDAQDAKDDGRAILLSIAAAAGLPEHIVTRDASNANFSSTQVSEAPGIATMQAIQADFFDDIRCIAMSTLRDLFPKKPDEFWERVEVEVAGPSIVKHNDLESTRARAIEHQAGSLSLSTWAAEAGRDWEKERNAIEDERDALATETPEDRNAPPPSRRPTAPTDKQPPAEGATNVGK